MRRNIVAIIACIFSFFFLAYVYKIVHDISHIQDRLLDSSNVIDVSQEIETKVLITSDDLPVGGNWTRAEFDDSGWNPVRIPQYIHGNPAYRSGNYVYYRIKVPAASIAKLPHLKNEIALGLQQVGFTKTEIFVNGVLTQTNSPKSSEESMTSVPVGNDGDQWVTIKGLITIGNMGIAHRGKIFLGKGAELNELHRISYKLMTVFPLIFILCKGIILFLFTMIFLVIRVSPFFDKFLLFGLFTISEDFLASNLIQKYFTHYQLTYLFTAVNIGALVSLYLFFCDAAGKRVTRQRIIIITYYLVISGALVSFDTLYANKFFTFSEFGKFWNLALCLVLVVMLPVIFLRNKILALGMGTSLGLTLWSTFFANDMGLNYKAYGNLILFVSVAFETFQLLRRDTEFSRPLSRS